MKLLSIALLALGAVQAQEVDPNTYQQTCELPSFQWADYGTRLTGRMYTRRAAYCNGSLYAAGYLKSTGAPDKEDFVETATDFCLTGPFNQEDPTGSLFATQVCSDLVSYTTEHGSFAQYEVGVVKIDTATGEPQDIFVYYGEGQDETSGLAVQPLEDGSEVMAVSGHFVGRLVAEHADGSKFTLYNSNAEGGSDYVQHPNAIQNGFDDGFVISANAQTGSANWMVAHPLSNKDAQTVGVDIDGEGNIYGAGYSCNVVGTSEPAEGETEGKPIVVCDGFVAKFAAEDGAILWEQTYEDLGAAMWIAYDETDDSLYVTGTTSYVGESTDQPHDTKNHPHCNHDICAVTMRLSASDGSTEWIRTTQGSPRWNFFDQTGDIQLADENLDGPYVYVALDDVGEEGLSTLDEGTPYAACVDADGMATPEYEIDATKLVTADDCPPGSTFVPRDDEENAFAASEANTSAQCGQGHEGVDACIIKYHKYTGLPMWGADVHPVAGLVPAVDGQSVMAAGFYYNSGTSNSNFDSVELPDYNGIEGSYNAKINAKTGKGEFVMHSGGIGKTRAYDIVGDDAGDLYMVGYTQSAVIQWGGSLTTKIIEEGIDQNDDAGTAFQMGKVSSSTSEYQFFAVKLGASSQEPLSCLESCDYNADTMVANPTIREGTCLIDNICYDTGDTAEIFGRSCLVCNPEKSQTEWSFGDVIGTDICFIDNVCYERGDAYSYRKSRRETFVSECQVCEPTVNAEFWSIEPGFVRVVADDDITGPIEPPHDCRNATASPTASPKPPAVSNGSEDSSSSSSTNGSTQDIPTLSEAADEAAEDASELSSSTSVFAFMAIHFACVVAAAAVWLI